MTIETKTGYIVHGINDFENGATIYELPSKLSKTNFFKSPNAPTLSSSSEFYATRLSGEFRRTTELFQEQLSSTVPSTYIPLEVEGVSRAMAGLNAFKTGLFTQNKDLISQAFEVMNNKMGIICSDLSLWLMLLDLYKNKFICNFHLFKDVFYHFVSLKKLSVFLENLNGVLTCSEDFELKITALKLCITLLEETYCKLEETYCKTEIRNLCIVQAVMEACSFFLYKLSPSDASYAYKCRVSGQMINKIKNRYELFLTSQKSEQLRQALRAENLLEGFLAGVLDFSERTQDFGLKIHVEYFLNGLKEKFQNENSSVYKKDEFNFSHQAFDREIGYFLLNENLNWLRQHIQTLESLHEHYNFFMKTCEVLEELKAFWALYSYLYVPLLENSFNDHKSIKVFLLALKETYQSRLLNQNTWMGPFRGDEYTAFIKHLLLVAELINDLEWAVLIQTQIYAHNLGSEDAVRYGGGSQREDLIMVASNEDFEMMDGANNVGSEDAVRNGRGSQKEDLIIVASNEDVEMTNGAEEEGPLQHMTDEDFFNTHLSLKNSRTCYSVNVYQKFLLNRLNQGRLELELPKEKMHLLEDLEYEEHDLGFLATTLISNKLTVLFFNCFKGKNLKLFQRFLEGIPQNYENGGKDAWNELMRWAQRDSKNLKILLDNRSFLQRMSESQFTTQHEYIEGSMVHYHISYMKLISTFYQQNHPLGEIYSYLNKNFIIQAHLFYYGGAEDILNTRKAKDELMHVVKSLGMKYLEDLLEKRWMNSVKQSKKSLDHYEALAIDCDLKNLKAVVDKKRELLETRSKRNVT